MHGGADAWLDPYLKGAVCLDAMIVRGLVVAGASDVLCRAFAGRLFWPSAVQLELRRAIGAVAGLAAFLDRECARVIHLDVSQESAARDLQLETFTRPELAKTATRNLGEAQSVVLCRERRMTFVSHDEIGRDWARRPKHHVRLGSLLDVLLVFVRLGHMRPRQAWACYERACANGLFQWPGTPISPAGKAHFMAQAEPLWSAYVTESKVR